jgi:eukaryotic-like serine/threonine-protein kinase
MTITATQELVDFLTRYQILSPSHLETLGRESQNYATASALCDELVQRGWLTNYQQTHLLSGQGDKLLLGQYRLLEPLGEGGMGLVVKGWHPRLDRYAAIKLIRPQVLATRPEIVTRFHREAKAIAQLHHPNVVMLYDYDEVDGTHYIAMEFVDGQTLEKMVRQNGPMAVKQSCDYMRQAALGLQHAAECGLVHRDIKPSNILVSTKGAGTAKRSSTQLKRPALVTIRDRQLSLDSTANGRSEHAWGTIKILDMGLARLQETLEEESDPGTPLTRAGALLGTPDFIAPEQARDARTVDIRADLYSLGCTFYYILTGRPPFPGGNDVQKLIKHQSERPLGIEELRPHVPSFVTEVVERLMAKQPEDRYQSPQALADVLTDYLASTVAHPTPPRGVSTEAIRTAPSPIPRSKVARSPWPAAAEPVVRDSFERVSEPAAEPDAATAMAEETTSRDVSATNMISCHAGVVAGVAISPDGRFAASGGVDGRLRVWDLTQSKPREVANLPREGMEIQAIAFAPNDPEYLVFGSTQQGNARIYRWDWVDNRLFEWGGFATNDHRGVGAVAFAPNGSAFAAGIGSFAVVWKINKRNASGRNILKGHGYPVRALAFAPDTRLLATAGESKSIRLWGFGWLGTSLKSTIEAHAQGVNSIAFSADGKRLAVAGLDPRVIIWDPLAPSEKTSTTLHGHNCNLRHVQFQPDGQKVVSVGETGHVFVWDAGNGQVVGEFALDLSMAYSIALTPDARRLAAGYSSGQLAIFDLTANRNAPASSKLLVASAR